ncbi:MAG: serpin family protein [Ruminococcus sp.]|nr:serpin family protein [Ruminococcus sp.]
MKRFKVLLCFILSALCTTLCCCTPESQSLTAGYSRSDAVPEYNFYSDEEITPENYAEFAESYMDFSASLLVNASEDESCVLSPLSLYTALCMTSNGASGKTLKELERVLGQDLSISEINTFIHYLNSRVKALNNEDGYVNTTNSLWLRDEYSVKSQFLQTIVNYYDAEVFRENLDSDGAHKINSWINKNTEGEIKDMVANLSADTAAVLINTLLFNDQWVTPYGSENISSGVFYGTKGEEQADFMTSNEMLLEANDAKGFVKSYKNTPCKFVAILPNEDISLEEYVSSLSGAKLEKLFESASGVSRCEAHIPQFELRTKLSLTDIVKSMGAELMLSGEANFDSLTMSEGLFVSDLLQESFLKLTPEGTEAGSASAVVMKDSASPSEGFETLTFNRPFLFMVVENEYSLPLFIGTVQNIN